jgi:DNA-binding PucR family transcriptional regulator
VTHFFEQVAAPTHCFCGNEKRANAIVCRECWFALPSELRFALPSKPGAERDRIAKLCVEFAEITLQMKTRGRINASLRRYRSKYASEAAKQKDRWDGNRQRQILEEVRAGQAEKTAA